ncbi:MAG: hypothetical protein KF799_06305 [Bdellovibrionales bacterium]|nr:hypothetical protein [Bdellovibrionales bacterium]
MSTTTLYYVFLTSAAVTTYALYPLCAKFPQLRWRLYLMNVGMLSSIGFWLTFGEPSDRWLALLIVNGVFQNILLAADHRPGRALIPGTYARSAD